MLIKKCFDVESSLFAESNKVSRRPGAVERGFFFLDVFGIGIKSQ